MASRTKQKEEARARRLAEEQARAERDQRRRRIQLLGGVVLIAAAIIAVAIAVSTSSGGSSNAAKLTSTTATSKGGGKQSNTVVPCKSSTDSPVCTLLAGIPQSGNTLGNPKAKVTVTEFGDLECSVCDAFALGTTEKTSAGANGTGMENQLIQNDVRSGKIKLVFRSLDTATGNGATPNMFVPQQAAAEAAGLQDKEWYYVELFYRYQGAEGSNYVNQNYLNTLAKHVPGLNFSKWLSDSKSQTLASHVSNDQLTAASRDFTSTPTIVVEGPKGQAQPIVGLPSSYSQIESEINSVQ
jgi:protein-disulfide isomerase